MLSFSYLFFLWICLCSVSDADPFFLSPWNLRVHQRSTFEKYVKKCMFLISRTSLFYQHEIQRVVSHSSFVLSCKQRLCRYNRKNSMCPSFQKRSRSILQEEASWCSRFWQKKQVGADVSDCLICDSRIVLNCTEKYLLSFCPCSWHILAIFVSKLSSIAKISWVTYARNTSNPNKHADHDGELPTDGEIPKIGQFLLSRL